MNSKVSFLLKIFNYVLSLIFIIYIFLLIHSLLDFFYNHAEYRFGTEVYGWKYSSMYHYIGSIITEFVFVLFSLVSQVIFRNKIISLLLKVICIIYLLSIAIFAN